MELRERVAGLMDRARTDLAELVAHRSVADPRQYPAEECGRAARWVVDRAGGFYGGGCGVWGDGRSGYTPNTHDP